MFARSHHTRAYDVLSGRILKETTISPGSCDAPGTALVPRERAVSRPCLMELSPSPSALTVGLVQAPLLHLSSAFSPETLSS